MGFNSLSLRFEPVVRSEEGVCVHNFSNKWAYSVVPEQLSQLFYRHEDHVLP